MSGPKKRTYAQIVKIVEKFSLEKLGNLISELEHDLPIYKKIYDEREEKELTEELLREMNAAQEAAKEERRMIERRAAQKDEDYEDAPPEEEEEPIDMPGTTISIKRVSSILERPESKMQQKTTGTTHIIEEGEGSSDRLSRIQERAAKKKYNYSMEQLISFDEDPALGEMYGVNVRGDVVLVNGGDYVGHWDGKKLTKGPKPADWDSVAAAMMADAYE